MKTKQVFSITAVALAVAMVAPTASAEVEAYLSLRPTIESTENADGERTTEVDDYYSRFGVKGSHQYGDLTVGAVGEFRAYDDKIDKTGSYELSRARYAYGYISGDFGKLTIGMTPDVMANNVTSFTEFGYSDGESFSRFYLNGHNGGGFKDHNIRYTFKADAFNADVSYRRVTNDITEYNIGGQYYLGDITLGAAYKVESGKAGEAATTKDITRSVLVGSENAQGEMLDSNGAVTTDPAQQAFIPGTIKEVVSVDATPTNKDYESKSIAVGASYSAGPLTVAGTYLRVDVNNDGLKVTESLNEKTPTSIELAAVYNVSDKVAVNAIYAKFDDNKHDSAYSVGMTYQIAPSALLFTTYEDVDNSYTKATVGFKFDLNIMSTGGMQ